MATGEARFTCRVKLEHDLAVDTPICSQVGFRLEIRTLIRDDNGNILRREVEDEAFQMINSVMPEFVFGRDSHRQFVTRLLIEAGWNNRNSLQSIMDAAFSEALFLIEREKTACGLLLSLPRIVFGVNKSVRSTLAHEIARALESSMQQEPKPVPATKQSIRALKKVKLEEGDNKEECVICMEQLVCSGAEKAITSMPCSHLFHGDCIEEWLSTSHVCPLCRFPMPTDG